MLINEKPSELRFLYKKIEDFNLDCGYIDIYETPCGGARVIMGELDNYLEVLEKLDARMKALGKNVEMDVNDNETGFVLLDQNGVQVPFDLIVEVLFG